jgi:hypothetical protein
MMKNSFRLMVVPKPNITTGFHRLVKGFKNFSQLFGTWVNSISSPFFFFSSLIDFFSNFIHIKVLIK